MKCYKCATPIPDNSRFCSACGADVSGDSHASAATISDDGSAELFNKLQVELGDEYILERELGRGGMAVVFLGHDARLGRKVAVKVLPPELTYGGKGSLIERFKREAQTAAKLDHPNIIPVYRVAPGGTLFWYVMKFLDGEPLDHILEREGQLTVERTVDIIGQVADALDYAHQNQVVHRDVKPANVVVDKKGRVTVTDFGIAKALDANTLTATGSIIGTPYYMSPEQCKGKRVGPAADQYSLAVMAYQMLGGHVPFTGDSAVEIVHKHVADPVPPLSVLRANLPEMVSYVVEKGLAKAAEDRFGSVADFARALKAAAHGVGIAASPPGAVPPVRISKTALISPVPGALRTAKGSKKGLLVAGAGVVVLAAVGIAVLTRGGPGPAPAQQQAAPVTQAPAASQQPAPVAVADTPATPAVRPPAPQPEVESARLGARSSTQAVRRQTTAPAQSAAAKRQVAAQPTRAPQPAPAAAAPQPAAAQPVVSKQEAPPVAAPQRAPSQAAPAAAGVGYLFLGTQPVSTIYVNGVARGSRLANLEVPAGTVKLRFQVQDSTGIWWAQDREVTVAPGESKRLGYIRLVRP